LEIADGTTGGAGRAIDTVLALASLSTLLGLATVATVRGARAILMRHGSRTLRFAALTGFIQHRLKRPHGHPQKLADPDRGDVASRSGVIGSVSRQSKVPLTCVGH
jgi:hypothetical protein